LLKLREKFNDGFIFAVNPLSCVGRRGPYSKGKLNKLIDSLIQPLAGEDPGILLVDGFLHALVEQNPPLTVRKFLRYNLPSFIEGQRKRCPPSSS